MTSDQIFTVAVASVPTMVTVTLGILVNNSGLSDLRSHVDSRFDDECAMWQADLRRVEEVLDARLKRLEER
jgi:hypothetical protein